MAGNKLIFKNAEEVRNAIMASQKKEIAKLYENWADEIGERAKYYSHKSTASAPVSERYYRELQKQLRATSQEVSNEVYKKIKSNIYTVADAVVSDNVKWLADFGFSVDGLNAAFSYVPDEIVRNLITGQIYESGWSLSSRIWSDNEQTLKDIYQVMAKGLAENKPIYEIAKDLESYVRPSAKLPWNLRMADGKKIYKKQVDYNAQRLARTLVQHGYQQSFIAATQKNPFITEYIWRSNGSRACPLCMDRDGRVFQKSDLPMDHPNGMCTIEPVVVDNMVDQLADWFNSPDGTYPEIDAFAKNFGYTANKGNIFSLESFKDKFGIVTNQNALQIFKGNLDDDMYSEWFSLQKQVKKDLGYTPGSGKDFWADYSSGKIKSDKLDEFFAKVLEGSSQTTSVNTAQKIEKIAKTKVKKASKTVSTQFDSAAWYETMRKQDLRTMESWCDDWLRAISSAERNGVEVYTGSAYIDINKYLRGQRSSTSYADEIRQATAALKKASLPEEVIVRRGSDYNMIKELGVDISEANKDKLVGAIVTDKGFMSTSPVSSGGFSGDIEYVIKVPKGSQAMYVDTISRHRGEEELLINRGGKYIIEDVEFNSYGDVKKIYMTLKNLKGPK